MGDFSYDTNPQPVNSGETSGRSGMGQFLMGAFFVMFFIFGVWAIIPAEDTAHKPHLPNEKPEAGKATVKNNTIPGS